MTFAQVETEFLKKYPNGNIFRKGNFDYNFRVSVTFVPFGKVYCYSCRNYGELFTKLNIPTCYKSKLDNLKSELEREVVELDRLNAIGINGNYEDIFFGELFTVSESDINKQQERIAFLQSEIEYASTCILV